MSKSSSSLKRFILPSIVLSSCLTSLPSLISGLLLLEISVTFGVDLGIGAQIRTAASVLGIIFAFVMGALSLRFSHKSLLLTGLVIYLLFALGCFFAPSFIVMLMFFSLSGMARARAWSFAIIFGTSFWRQRFLVSTDFISTVLVGSASCFILGGLTCGRFVNKFGRKDTTTLSVLLVGTLIISYANVASLWLSIVLGWSSSFFSGMMFAASDSLKLEQVPKYRGTMMSLNSAAGHFGQTTAGVIGGLVFATYGYNILAIILGILGFFASLIYHFLTVDPTKKIEQSSIQE